MNYIKTNTVGVDVPIKRIQTRCYDGLVALWGVNDFDAYGRVYKNKKKDKVIPEYYVGNKEYKSVLLDDRRTGIMFFDIGDSVNVNGTILSTACEVLFSVNISSLNGDTERTDAEVQKDAFNLLNKYQGIFSIDNIYTGLNNVYNEFTGVSSYFRDMQKFHHFKISGIINYTNNNC